MKKTILLYNPKAVFFDLPLALLAIGSQVDKDYNVVIVDARIESPSRINELIDNYLESTIIVGVTSLTGAPLIDAIAFTELIRSKNKKVRIVWGGWHTSLFPEKTLQDIPAVDIAVVGQGETAFKEIVEKTESNGDLNSVKGIVFRENSEIIKTPPRVLTDMNEYGRLNYDLIDLEKYFRAKGRRQFDFITSIGCFFRCTFCADPFVFNRKFSALEPSRIARDLMYYHEKCGFDDLNFQDETFFTYPEKIIEMAEAFKSRGTPFTWAATMRADQGSRMTKEQFLICKQGGLRRLLIGVESGSQEMMDWLKKDIKIEQVEQCAKWCKELEIAVIFPFIVGFPGETEESVLASKKMIRKLALMSPNFETPIFYFKPYPGTKITDDVVSKGEFQLPESVFEWADFDYIGSKGPWVSDEKYAFFERYKFYLKVYRQRKSSLLFPLRMMAKWRIDRFNFKAPIEKYAIELVKNKQKLS